MKKRPPVHDASGAAASEVGPGRRAGTVALVGRPNAGKSTLMNRLLAEKVAIVSDKPQTTRHRLVGILSDERGQMVFYDTPGIHRPLHRLNKQMVRHAVDAMNDADARCLLVDAAESFGAGDAYMLDLMSQASAPRLLALNKIDKVRKPDLLPMIDRCARSGVFAEIVRETFGSHTTMSASLPTAIVPLRGKRPNSFAGLVEPSATSWFNPMTPLLTPCS